MLAQDVGGKEITPRKIRRWDGVSTTPASVSILNDIYKLQIIVQREGKKDYGSTSIFADSSVFCDSDDTVVAV